MTDDSPIIDPQQELIDQSAVKAVALMKKYPNLKVLLVGAAAFVGEEDPDDKNALCNVAFIFEAPVQSNALAPNGQPVGGMALHIKTPVGAHAGLIARLQYDQAPPYYYPRDLNPVDAHGLLDLYDQLRRNAKPAFTAAQWAEVRDPAMVLLDG